MLNKKSFKKKRGKSFLSKQYCVLLFGLILFFPLYSQAYEDCQNEEGGECRVSCEVNEESVGEIDCPTNVSMEQTICCVPENNACQDAGGDCIDEEEDCEGETQSEGCSSGQVCCIEDDACQDAGGDCIDEEEDCEGETQSEGCSSGQVCCIEDDACQDAGGDCIDEEEDCEGETQSEGCSSGQVCCIEDPEGDNQCPEYEEGIGGGFLMLEGHLVPCGRQCDDPGTENDETATCTLCHFFLLMKNVFDLVLSLIIICSILAVTIGGVLYIVSTGKSELQKKGKEIIQYTLTAFALLLLSWLLVYTLLNWLGAKTELLDNGSNWFEFECDTESSFEEGAKAPQKEGEPDETNYTFQSGIEDQYDNDASDALESFLGDLKLKLPAEAKEISSISDNAGMENCIPENYSQSPCAHTKYSCHYGGRECIRKSYAVDFANEAYYDQIKEAVEEVESDAYVKYESDHVHVSIGRVNGCGCN